MKKFFKTLAIASACVCGVCGFSACDDKGMSDGGDGVTEDEANDYIENIIKDEQTWNSAFENVSYANFSSRVGFGGMSGNYCEVTPDAVYYNLADNYMYYSLRNADGTYTTYINSDGTNGIDTDRKWTLSEDTSDRYLKGAQTETVMRVSYADYFELFTFDEESKSYVYDGMIQTLVYNQTGDQSREAYCFNSVIKVENNKIVSIKCEYNFNGSADEAKSMLEYFNIGSTTVTVPDEVKNSAVKQ